MTLKTRLDKLERATVPQWFDGTIFIIGDPPTDELILAARLGRCSSIFEDGKPIGPAPRTWRR